MVVAATIPRVRSAGVVVLGNAAAGDACLRPSVPTSRPFPVLAGGFRHRPGALADTACCRGLAASTGRRPVTQPVDGGLGAANLAAGFFRACNDQQQIRAHAVEEAAAPDAGDRSDGAVAFAAACC